MVLFKYKTLEEVRDDKTLLENGIKHEDSLTIKVYIKDKDEYIWRENIVGEIESRYMMFYKEFIVIKISFE